MANPKVIGGFVIAVGGLALLFSGKAGAAKRPPYKQPIPVPPNEKPWAEIDQALCLCAESDTPDADVPLCALLRVYPGVPWPARAGDHPSVLETEKAVRQRWEDTDGLCSAEPQEPDEPEDPEIPSLGRFTNRGGGFFWGIDATDKKGLTGVVRDAWQLPQGHRAVLPLIEMCTRSLANLARYGRREASAEYGAQRINGTWYTCGPAFLPRNAASTYLGRGQWPPRTIGVTGARVDSSATSYGQLWLPKAQIVGGQPVLEGGVTPDELPPDDPRLLPPLTWLAWATATQTPQDAIAILWGQFGGDTQWAPPLPTVEASYAPMGFGG